MMTNLLTITPKGNRLLPAAGIPFPLRGGFRILRAKHGRKACASPVAIHLPIWPAVHNPKTRSWSFGRPLNWLCPSALVPDWFPDALRNGMYVTPFDDEYHPNDIYMISPASMPESHRFHLQFKAVRGKIKVALEDLEAVQKTVGRCPKCFRAYLWNGDSFDSGKGISPSLQPPAYSNAFTVSCGDCDFHVWADNATDAVRKWNSTPPPPERIKPFKLTPIDDSDIPF